jgi:hypothetical protein
MSCGLVRKKLTSGAKQAAEKGWSRVKSGKEHTSGAKQAAEKLEISGEISEKHPSVAKASIDSVGFMRGLKPPPPSALSFSAACKARRLFCCVCGTTEVVP